MPPVNTYGVRKKKCIGIPKYILNEAPTTDLFDALKIENIKETKAIADAKKRERRRLREITKKPVAKPVAKPVQSVTSSFNKDSAFDKLLDGSGDWQVTSYLNINTCANVSSSFEESVKGQKAERGSHPKLRHQPEGNVKGVMKKRTSRVLKIKQDSIFASSLGRQKSLEEIPLALRLRDNKTAPSNKENLDMTDSSESDNVFNTSSSAPAPCQISVARHISAKPDVRTCEEKVLSLSPIHPLRGHSSTSTPCEKPRMSVWPSPVMKTQSLIELELGAPDPSNQNVREESKDLFSSFDHLDNDADQNDNKCAEDDSVIPLNIACKKSFSTTFDGEPYVSQESHCPLSPDIFLSGSIARSSMGNALEESCVVLNEECGNTGKSNFSVFAHDPTKPDRGTFKARAESEVSIPCGIEHSLPSPPVKRPSENRNSFPKKKSLDSTPSCHTEPLSGCYVLITRCDGDIHSPRDGEEKHISPEKFCRSNEPHGSVGVTTDLSSSLPMSSGCMSEQTVDSITSCLDELKISTVRSFDHHRLVKIQSCSEQSFVDVCSSLESSPCRFGNSNQPSSSNMVENLGNASDVLHNDSLANMHTESISSSSRSDNDSAYRNCQVVLRRCDSPLLSAPEEIAAFSKKNQTLNCSKLDCEVVEEKGNSPKQPNRNSIAKFSMSRLSQNHRLSTQPETIVLKPGKQWRRSLSILSRIRLSAGESSGCSRDSLSTDETRLKGKLWESAVNSVVQLQPVNDVILEETDTSIRSVCTSSICGRNSTSFGGNKIRTDSIILEPSNSESTESSAALIFRRCGQTGPVPFQDRYPSTMKNRTRKIGEGVYGEVFFYSGCANRREAVIKIIPIEGLIDVNGEPQKKFGEIFSEVCIAQELSKLRKGSVNVTSSFNELLDIHCVQGCYPEWLQDLWHDYDELKGSENDSPEIFQEDQLYIVLELQNGGKDLESFIFSSADQGLAAFRQIALTLAVGERSLGFEHRDLHWGNVLISSTKKKDINFILNREPISTASKGIEVSIIDFTLSRITDPSSGRPIYFDLSSDETLFSAEGDYQFDIYRLMKEYCGNIWETFTPRTNIAWLHYLLDKLCTMARYKNRSSKVHNKALNVLLEMKDTILMFESVTRFVKCPLFSQ